jgi:ribosomal protein S18 acetylase RimI-like enzyme
MIKTKTGMECIDWTQLVELYAQTELVGGLGIKRDMEGIKKAFLNSSKVITAWDGAHLSGAGRMLTDGVVYAYILDIAVLPGYRRQGVATAIVKELLVNTENISVHLTSRFGVEDLYRKLGFKRHKNAFAKYPHESPYLEG